MVAVPGSAEVHGVCVSYVRVSLWEQRESESATDLSRMPVGEKKTVVKTFRRPGARTDARRSVTIDGLEVRVR